MTLRRYTTSSAFLDLVVPCPYNICAISLGKKSPCKVRMNVAIASVADARADASRLPAVTYNLTASSAAVCADDTDSPTGADGFTACTNAEYFGVFCAGFARVVCAGFARVVCAEFVMMKFPSGYAPIGAVILNIIGALH